ncbi:FecR domain-containing protein [Stappia sp. F7233]|uniref:FecR domain-containing protein n=1 Tax=Stappia albiluteola TaxID=2758565 RepID=A0A839AHK6_9HYPH|nr:FecR domain-containing protein [Stappia albiluteola]MBA5779201.1 FecR domain-containing protein [Stappia albiluteola]
MFAWGVLAAGMVSAAPVAGKAVDAQPDAELSNSRVKVVIVSGTAVTQGDRITTDARGLVQLLFSDETKLVVGPRSSLVIESYLLRSSNRANSFSIRALGGSFRMITGKSRKQAYKITTPTATIGVRGTEFDFTVQRSGMTEVVLFSGEATVCGRNGGGCKVLNGRCTMVQAAPRQNVRSIQDRELRARALRANFPYIASQQPLRRDFRVSLRGCDLLQPPPERQRQQIERVRNAAAAPIAVEPAPPPPEPPPGVTRPSIVVTVTGPRGGQTQGTLSFGGGSGPTANVTTTRPGDGEATGGFGASVEFRGLGSDGTGGFSVGRNGDDRSGFGGAFGGGGGGFGGFGRDRDGGGGGFGR